MISATVLATVPAALRSEYAAGSVYRVGMLLFRKGQSGIIGYIVETSALAPAVSSLTAGNPLLGAANIGVDSAGHLATNIQLH